MTRTLLIIVGLVCAVITAAAPLLASMPSEDGYPEKSFLNGMLDDIFELPIPEMLATLAIVILLVVLTDTLVTRRKNNLKNKIQEVKNKIKDGTRIAKDNQHSLLIRFVRLAIFALCSFVIVGLVFTCIRGIFGIYFTNKIVFAVTAGLLLLIAGFRMLSVRTIITVGLACAVITVAGMIYYTPVNVARRQLHDKNIEVRYKAVYKLAELGDKASIPAFTFLLLDKDINVRVAAVYALGKLDAKESIPNIAKLLHHFHPFIRKCAAEALSDLDAKETIPEIKKLLKDSEYYVRDYAKDALKKLGMTEAEIEEAKNAKTTEEEWGAPTLEGLQCRITADKNTYKIGENIILTGEIKNCTDDPISIISKKDSPFAFLALMIEDSSGVATGFILNKAEELLEMSDLDFTTCPPGEKYKLWRLNIKAGQTFCRSRNSDCNKTCPVPFRANGQYTVWFEYEQIEKAKVSPPILPGTASSNKISINVTD